LADFDDVLVLARRILVPRDARSAEGLLVWEHSLRVVRITEHLAARPDLPGDRPDPMASRVAALFHNAGWLLDSEDRPHPAPALLSRPTSDIQLELAAGCVMERLADVLPQVTVELAAEAIRQSGDHRTQMPEARVVSDAESVEETGLSYALRRVRQSQGEGRPLEQVVASWQQQQEYHFWEARIAALHFEASRELARRRLEAVSAFMTSLAREISGGDLS
jgi:hypothetical protein